METLEEILAHHGIKGMKWGVRRVRNASGELVEVQMHKNPIGQVYKTSGGQNHPTHPDAEKAMKVRQQVKGSGLHSVSNKELQDAVNRMNLEMNYVRAVQTRQGKTRLQKAQEFTKQLLGLGKSANEAMDFAKSPAGQEMQKKFKQAKAATATKVS